MQLNRQTQALAHFQIGDKANVLEDKGTITPCTIEKINVKTATVCTDNGDMWRVPASMLELIDNEEERKPRVHKL